MRKILKSLPLPDSAAAASPAEAEPVPAEPHLQIQIRHDGSCAIDGKEVTAANGQLRAAAIDQAAATARTLGRPVRVTATEPGAAYRLIVRPDGTTGPAPAPPQPAPGRRRRKPRAQT
jgi:hypothetical protein